MIQTAGPKTSMPESLTCLPFAMYSLRRCACGSSGLLMRGEYASADIASSKEQVAVAKVQSANKSLLPCAMVKTCKNKEQQ